MNGANFCTNDVQRARHKREKEKGRADEEQCHWGSKLNGSNYSRVSKKIVGEKTFVDKNWQMLFSKHKKTRLSFVKTRMYVSRVGFGKTFNGGIFFCGTDLLRDKLFIPRNAKLKNIKLNSSRGVSFSLPLWSDLYRFQGEQLNQNLFLLWNQAREFKVGSDLSWQSSRVFISVFNIFLYVFHRLSHFISPEYFLNKTILGGEIFPTKETLPDNATLNNISNI